MYDLVVVAIPGILVVISVVSGALPADKGHGQLHERDRLCRPCRMREDVIAQISYQSLWADAGEKTEGGDGQERKERRVRRKQYRGRSIAGRDGQMERTQ